MSTESSTSTWGAPAFAFASWTVIIAAIAIGFYDYTLQDAVVVGMQGALGIVLGIPLIFLCLLGFGALSFMFFAWLDG